MFKLVLSLIVTVFIGQLLPQALHNQWLYWFITLPGTLLHEAAHYALALILNGHPSGFSLIPTTDVTGNISTLGHILFEPNWYNASAAALAPYLLIFPSLILVYKASSGDFAKIPIWAYFAACGFASFDPSSADWNIAISQPISFIFTIPIFCTITVIFIKFTFIKVKQLWTK